MRLASPVAVAAVLFMTGLAYVPSASLASQQPSSPAGEPEGYLVAPFVNASNVKNLDWMSSALAVTLAEKLEALPQLRPVYGAQILEGWPASFDEAKALEKAREMGARWIFAGSFTRPNWKSGVQLRLLQVTDTGLKEVASRSENGERDDLLKLLDGAMDGLLADRSWVVEGDALAALHRRPTKDLYALTLFGRSLNLFYGLNVAKNDEQAQKILTRTTFIDPKFAEARRALGVIDLARGDTGKAVGQYAYALELKPGYYQAIVGLARLYREEQKKQPAREMAEKALSMRPYDVEMRLLLGTLEWENSELDKALVDLLKVCEARPKLVAARRTLAQIYSSRGDIEDLAGELGKLAELSPEDIDVKLDLGSAFMRLGRNEKAIAAYEDVLKKQPRHVQALKFTGDLYRRQGDPRRAIEVYERVKHLSPDDPRAYFLLGAAYSEAGNDTKAIAVLEDAQQFRSYQGEAWTDLGALHLRRGDMNRANYYLTKAVGRAPMRPKAHFNYALVLDANNQRDKALAELKTASELDPEDAECHYLSGVIHLRMGQLDEAKLEFAEALRLKPGHTDAKHNLALLEDLDKRYGSEHAGVGAQ